ncbi:hypothetical protein [Aquimarina longa]|uniref:hypothetical protein n=1 Tax=Aquimarina longa TaxID=1080221 RepID=UPI000783E0A5|nr:hypothetical protein [Aquimarina longa]
MKHTYKRTIALCILVLFFSGKKHPKNSPMNITRGLKPAIATYTSLEQEFIIKVANKMKDNGFPVNQVTRVHLSKRILTHNDYYSYNEIVFFINPGVYKQDKFNWGIENIGIGWEDPSVIRTPDGGMEFEIGYKTKPEDLIMNLYRLDDSYSYGTLLKNHNSIIKKINDILLANTLEEIKYFTSKGILELIKNYLIVITTDNENVYEMKIRKIDHKLIDTNHFNKLFKQYHLKIHLNTSTIEILDSFDPTFFPTPIADPIKPIIKKN